MRSHTRAWSSIGPQEVNAMKRYAIVIEKGARKEIYKKKFLNQEGILARTWWDNTAYSARDNGTRLLVDLFGGGAKNFEFPMPLSR